MTSEQMISGLAQSVLEVLRKFFSTSYIASVVCVTFEKLELSATVTALGAEDGSCAGEEKAAKKILLEAALGITVTVKSLTSRAPPVPPPSPPPSPGAPPLPPATPPGQPQYPPFVWYTTYYDGDCQETGDGCPKGCRRSLWSESFTWEGQRAEIGGGPLPSFKANVTIKRCQTVVLDLDLNVQLYSLVVWGTLIVENRPGAAVFLRTTCITIKHGGRLLAGRPSPALTGTQSKRPPYVDSYPLTPTPTRVALTLTLTLTPTLTLALALTLAKP